LGSLFYFVPHMFIPESLLQTHCISIIGFLIATLCMAKLRKVKSTYLSTANSIAAVLALVNVMLMTVDQVNAWEASPDHIFFKYRSAVYLPFIIIYVAAISLSLLKKLRATVLFSLILVIVYSCLISHEIAYMIITGFNGASGRSNYSAPLWKYVMLLSAAAIYSLICYLIAVRIHAQQNH